MWKLGRSWYAILSGISALVAPLVDGQRSLHHLDLSTGVMVKIDYEYTDISDLHRINQHEAICIAGRSNSGRKIVLVTLGTNAVDSTFREINHESDRSRKNDMIILGDRYISKGEHFTLTTDFPPPTSRSAVGSRKVDLHATLYSPLNPEYRALDGELPPAMAIVHSGPTSRNPSTLNLLYQYFTTRGFAVVDVDYGGSSGYGREYQNRLSGRWGEVDVYDVCRAVVELGNLGRIDKDRVAIRGSSAGKALILEDGYTVKLIVGKTFRRFHRSCMLDRQRGLFSRNIFVWNLRCKLTRSR